MKNPCRLVIFDKHCCAGIENTRQGVLWTIVLRTRWFWKNVTSEGRLAERHIDGYFQCPVSCAIIGVLLLVGGCAKPKPKVVAKPKLQAKELRELKGAITGAGWHIPWSARDPKNPHGKPLRMMVADAEQGALKNDDGNVRMVLEKARVKLFRDGKPSAFIDAKILSANREENVVIGTGGVVVNSVQNPPDTRITAEKMVWDTGGTKVIAVGDAQVKHRLRNGTMATSRGGRVTFDLKSEEIEIE